MPIEIDTKMLQLVRCPDGCARGIGIDHGNPFFCGTCEGTGMVFYPASLLAKSQEAA